MKNTNNKDNKRKFNNDPSIITNEKIIKKPCLTDKRNKLLVLEIKDLLSNLETHVKDDNNDINKLTFANHLSAVVKELKIYLNCYEGNDDNDDDELLNDEEEEEYQEEDDYNSQSQSQYYDNEEIIDDNNNNNKKSK